jgi:putative flippase GtrA
MWTFKQAPAQSDIIWKSMGVDENFSLLKTSILLILLFLFSVVILTPVMLITQAQAVVAGLDLPYRILSS